MTYAKLPGLTWDGTIYENGEMGDLEALLPTGGYPTAHAPAMAELPNGDLLCCWFAGTYEGSADIHIICSLLPKDAPAWLPPVDISGDPERSEQNPSLFCGPDGAVWAMYTAQLDRQAGKDNMQFTAVVRCQKSTDGGRTWGPYTTVFPEQGTFCRQPIQILSNGRWIFANWLCTDSAEGLSGDPTAFRISDDEGKTWRMVRMPKSNGHVHANVIELAPGHLVAFMRNREAYQTLPTVLEMRMPPVEERLPAVPQLPVRPVPVCALSDEQQAAKDAWEKRFADYLPAREKQLALKEEKCRRESALNTQFAKELRDRYDRK